MFKPERSSKCLSDFVIQEEVELLPGWSWQRRAKAPHQRNYKKLEHVSQVFRRHNVKVRKLFYFGAWLILQSYRL